MLSPALSVTRVVISSHRSTRVPIRRWMALAAPRGSKATGVIEERPLPVVVDLHTPTQLGTVYNGVDKPGVRGVLAVKIVHRDNFAVWADNSKLRHATRLSLPIDFQSHVMSAYQFIERPKPTARCSRGSHGTRPAPNSTLAQRLDQAFHSLFIGRLSSHSPVIDKLSSLCLSGGMSDQFTTR